MGEYRLNKNFRYSAGIDQKFSPRFGVNVLFTAPTAVRMWMSHGAAAPARYDLSRLRLVATSVVTPKGEPSVGSA